MTGDVVPLRLIPGEGIELLDQTLLPHEVRYLRITAVEPLCEAIRSLRVRGAPLLGLSGACGMAIACSSQRPDDETLSSAAERLAGARPTAVDLPVAVQAALELALRTRVDDRATVLWDSALAFAQRRLAEDRRLAELGARLLTPGTAALTHCNTGSLATGGIGTALGVVRVAWEQGRLTRCYATETRPLLQGARLTAWELSRLGIPASLLPDSAAASLIASGRVQAVITGADRIAANGDSANKVGTYGLAVASARHGLPFYIAAPLSTFDRRCPTGESIPIEFRDPAEVGGFGPARWAPEMDAYNPAFDVTPGELIAAIVTERGVARPPYQDSLRALAEAPSLSPA